MRFTGIRLPLLAAVACASVGLSSRRRIEAMATRSFVLPTSRDDFLSSPYVVTQFIRRPLELCLSQLHRNILHGRPDGQPAAHRLHRDHLSPRSLRPALDRRAAGGRSLRDSLRSDDVRIGLRSDDVRLSVCPDDVRVVVRSDDVRHPRLITRPPIDVSRYRPTTYTYYPTVYETAYTTPADICCDEVVVDSTVRSVPQSSVRQLCLAEAQGSRVSLDRTPTRFDSYVDTPLPDEMRRSSDRRCGATAKAQPRPTRIAPTVLPIRPLRPLTTTPRPKPRPKVRAAQRHAEERARAEIAGAAPRPRKQPPTAPADDSDSIDLRPAPGDDGVLRRDSLKAIYLAECEPCRPAKHPLRHGRNRRRQTARRSAGDRRQSEQHARSGTAA